MAKYTPKTTEELQKLVQDESIYLGDIDTSAITDMVALFQDSTRKNFSGIELWDTSNVIMMGAMFYKAKYFNHNINSWDVSNVVAMNGIFQGAESFNQPLDKWDTSSVIDMSSMFMGAENFNQPLDKWDTSNVINMTGMFMNAENFNQPLDSWDVSNVEFMLRMFYNAESFKQNLNSWDISSVRDNQQMFWYSGVENLPKWWENRVWGKKLSGKANDDESDEIRAINWEIRAFIREVINQILANPRSKEERQKEKEQKQKAEREQKQREKEQRQRERRADVKMLLKVLLCIAVVVIVFIIALSSSNEDSKPTPPSQKTTPKQSASTTQTQQPQQSNTRPQPKPQEIQKVGSENVVQNSAQSVPSQNIQASFDCAKASTKVEKLICSDSELASLDIELSQAYANARNSLDAAGKKALLDEQRKWLEAYNQCDDKPCVLHNMQIRIKTLQSYGGKGLRLKTSDEYVNLRQSPSGEILTAIYKSDFDKITLQKLETNGKWVKVRYVAPNQSEMIGYIHISQIDESSL